MKDQAESLAMLVTLLDLVACSKAPHRAPSPLIRPKGVRVVKHVYYSIGIAQIVRIMKSKGSGTGLTWCRALDTP